MVYNLAGTLYWGGLGGVQVGEGQIVGIGRLGVWRGTSGYFFIMTLDDLEGNISGRKLGSNLGQKQRWGK